MSPNGGVTQEASEQMVGNNDSELIAIKVWSQNSHK